VIDVPCFAQFLNNINPATGAFASISGQQYRSYRCWPSLSLDPLLSQSFLCFAVEANIHHRLSDETAKLAVVQDSISNLQRIIVPHIRNTFRHRFTKLFK
jgi:hypothetical protein